MPSLLNCDIPEQAWLKETGERNGSSTKPASACRGNAEGRARSDAGPWEPFVEEMVAFQHLGDDWDGQGALAPSFDLLASAIGLAYLLQEQGVDPPSRVVPGLEGSVILDWQDPDGSYTEVEIVRPLYAEVMVVVPGKPAKHWTIPNK